MKGEDFAAC